MAPRASGRVTWRADVGLLVPIPTLAFGAATVVLPSVVVPVDAPILTAVAAPPKLMVVAFALSRLNVPVVLLRLVQAPSQLAQVLSHLMVLPLSLVLIPSPLVLVQPPLVEHSV